jgi:pyruvate formate lyase activating enzyme
MHELEGRIVPDRSKPVPRELAGVCPSLALRVAGREVEAEVLVREVLKDRAFFDKSGGGVTFSGGEPLNHPEVLLESIVRFEAEGVSVAIETCLAVEAPVLLPFLGHNIHWLVDVKHTDADKLADKTAGDALAILELVRLIASREAQVTYRVPLIPRFNDSDADRDAILSLIASLERPPSAGVRVDLLPYHDLAAGKYQQLGRANPYTRERIAPLTLESWKNAAATRGIDLSWGG